MINGKISEYKIGAKYDGEQKDGKRQGKGIYIYPNGGKYEGNWKDNMKHG